MKASRTLYSNSFEALAKQPDLQSWAQDRKKKKEQERGPEGVHQFFRT